MIRRIMTILYDFFFAYDYGVNGGLGVCDSQRKKHTHKEDDIHTHKWGITIIQISHNTEQPAGHIGKIL